MSKTDDKIFRKIIIPTVNKISRNIKNNIFSNGSTYKKLNHTVKQMRDIKKIVPRNFINTSTNYDSNIDDKNFSNIDRTHTESNKKFKETIKQRFLIKK